MSLKKIIVVVICLTFLGLGWAVIITQFYKLNYIDDFVDVYFDEQEKLVEHLMINCSLSKDEVLAAHEYIKQTEKQCSFGELKRKEFFKKLNEFTTQFNQYVDDWDLTYEEREAKPDCMTEQEFKEFYEPIKKEVKNFCIRFYGDIPGRTGLYFLLAKNRIPEAFEKVYEGNPPTALFPE